ncbi:MAG TPA: ferrochelatase [Candidatus Limnocylindria bacterium]|nr:ferrochelatase [Candidatus Limnocylindria bacterium]
MRTGVLLMTYGAPQDEADLTRYLAAVRGGREPDAELVREMARRYAVIGGSPLIARTQAQAAALERELGAGYLVSAGMRFSDPSIDAAALDLLARGATRLAGIVLSPQWSPTLMGGYERALRSAGASCELPVALAGAWHREPLFIDALAALVGEALRDMPEAMVLLTAHSLPRRVFDAEPDYIAQLRATGELVARAAGLASERWRWAYQSAGHTQEEWLRPDLMELFPEIAASGARDVVVAPVQFLSDHLEVLYDLDVAAAQQAAAAGLRYHRIRMPNTDPRFIRALAAVARAAETPLLDAVRAGARDVRG